MAAEDNGIFGEERSTVTLRERLTTYLAHWPIFLLFLALCVGAGVIYSRYAIPQYIATTSFLVKGAESGGGTSSNDLVQQTLNGNQQQVNLNNEMLMINAASLMRRTVAKYGFNITYFKKGRLLTLNVYDDKPFRFVPQKLTDSLSTYDFRFEKLTASGGKFFYGVGDAEKEASFRWNKPFGVKGQTFLLQPNGTVPGEEEVYLVQWQPVADAAARLSGQINTRPFDPETSVIELSMKTDNLLFGKDVLNALFTEFNLTDIEDRNRLSENTVSFIDDRLVQITGELKGVEGTLESYKGSNQLVDIGGQSNINLENSNSASKNIQDLAVQQGVVRMISDYFSKPGTANTLVPSSLGINDATLSSLITRYNEVQLQKNREAPLVAPNSTVMQDLNTQLGNLKSSIFESLTNINKNLKLQERSSQQQNSQYRSFLSSLPRNERVLQEIRRKQSITEGIYLYLLQEREEAAISSTASNVEHYKQIDPATGYGPVEPNKKNIIIYTALLGLLLGFGWVYVKDLLNDKIKSPEDIARRTGLPLIGEISHLAKGKKAMIHVLERNIVGEQFRSVRANLAFLLKERARKVVLITSSVSGEGKSFISLNLAAACAIPGKRVALLEFDIRKPVLEYNLHLQLDNSIGLTQYLTGATDDLSSLVHHVAEIPTLHIYPSGPVLSNPADLLLTDQVATLFQTLKKDYDYIIVDSPPAGLVSDSFILAEYADLVLFVLRQRSTLKKQLDYITGIGKSGKFKKIALVLNDMKTGSKYGYYGNGYEKYEREISKQKLKIPT